MALIKCPGCGRDVSDSSRECPHCGEKIDIQKQNKKENIIEDVTSYLTSLIIVAIIMVIAGIFAYFTVAVDNNFKNTILFLIFTPNVIILTNSIKYLIRWKKANKDNM